MRKKEIEATLPVKPNMDGWATTAQVINGILVLNIYKNKALKARHCFNCETKEYATLSEGVWSQSKVETAYDIAGTWYDRNWQIRQNRQRFEMQPNAKKTIMKCLGIKAEYERKTLIDVLSEKEEEYGRHRRDMREQNRWKRVCEKMDTIPKIPKGIYDWIDEKHMHKADFRLRIPNEDKVSCTACGEVWEKDKAKDKEIVICPHCGKELTVINRKKEIIEHTDMAILQPVNNKYSVIRHFRAWFYYKPEKKKKIEIYEEVRILLNKDGNGCEIFYEHGYPDPVIEGTKNNGYFDSKGNPINKHIGSEYLYEAGIEEALKDTLYNKWTRMFKILSEKELQIDYNRMMCAKEQEAADLFEMLYKGRFYKLLQEAADNISIWDGKLYSRTLKKDADSIEGVFGIKDRQKINRIRDRNGGKEMICWMRWSERHKAKLPDKILDWLEKNKIEAEEGGYLFLRFSPEQAMNFIERQQREQYKRRSIRQIIEQYEDYMSMCEKLGKDTTDEMIYKPRELKRRHDECVREIEFQNAQIEAAEYSKKFKAAEGILKKIKKKFEYFGKDYQIIVPDRIVDIVLEGRTLHHCVGSTNRYFDRIKENETYIVFLRKKEMPDIPFYTIEVEPGGTIRQHRGAYDEQPELDKVKPFLKEWQKEIKKRMTEEDKKKAADSKVKRENNLKELKEQNNTRVLKGLMEDFMEAM